MQERDFQTLSLFMILAVLTVLFVLGSRVVLFAPLNEQARQTRLARPIPAVDVNSIQAEKGPLAP